MAMDVFPGPIQWEPGRSTARLLQSHVYRVDACIRVLATNSEYDNACYSFIPSS